MNALAALLTPEKVSRLSLVKVADVGEGFTLKRRPTQMKMR